MRHLGIAMLLVGGAATAQTPFDRAKKRYDECIQRLPFNFHTEGREKVAAVESMAALEVLARDYAKPAAHPDYSRYTLATLLGRHFHAPVFLPRLAALRRAHRKSEHAWLWVHTLAAQVRREGPEEALETALEAKSPFLRAAAVLALARAEDESLLKHYEDLCADLPRNEGERRAMISALSTALLELDFENRGEDFKSALRSYIRVLGCRPKLSRTLQLMIVRHLSKLLNNSSVWINPEPWLELVDRPVQPAARRESVTTARPRFFGIESDGERICYLLDMSDSMCAKVDDRIKPKAAITGLRKKKRKRGALPDETDLPWFEINTRFDLAREHLKISLQRLGKGKRFSVIWFGTAGGTLESCNGMIKATRGNVARVIKELDAIELGPANADAPDGTLRGRTNLHGALRRAFAMKARGHVETHDFVDAKVLAQGCDTIFLLTDGAPSWDDFAVIDKDYGEGIVVRDTEYGRQAPRSHNLEYWGPYGFPRWIVEDVRRMNAFRNVQIHCVGIGEADMQVLKQVAEVTQGEAYEFGRVRGK